MSKIWQPQSNEILRHWVDTIIHEASDKLNDWENKFICDMEFRIHKGYSLTESQEKKLESIYAEKTS